MKTIDFWSGDEWLPVELITNNTGILKGLSINPEFGFNDMVLLDFKEKEITQVIKKNTKTIFYAYDILFSGADKDWNKLEIFFKREKLYVQKHVDGLFLLSVPINFNDNNLEDIILRCPVRCFEITPEELYDSEEDDEDDDGGIFYLN